MFLTPAAGTDMQNRPGGFSIHGGGSPGSAGCIDATSNATRFLNAVDRSTPMVPVFVSYAGIW